jgi:SAM-dependent methyltransferase
MSSTRRVHWSEFPRVWAQYTPPLRPNGEVVAAVRDRIGAPGGRTLLLGVTPELADIAPNVVAVDKNPSMVANLWPGNNDRRCAVVGNWLNTNFAADVFDCCVGDGSLNAVRYPDEMRLLCSEVARVLRSGGKIVLRVFIMPDATETMEAVQQSAIGGKFRSFHGFKWRLAMAIAGQANQPSIEMRRVFDAFSRMFPDRDRLVAITGWSRDEIDTIDILQDSVAISSFPTRGQLLSVVSAAFVNSRLVPVGTYEAAELCPLLVAERA